MLSRAGHRVSLYPTPGRFFDALARAAPQAIFVDMTLPGMHGREVIRVLRADPRTRQILILAMSGQEKLSPDIVSGFQSGADEYLVKPVDGELLLARLHSLAARGPRRESEEAVSLGGLTVRPPERQCLVRGREVRLTRLEFDLILHLLEHAGRVLTRGALFQAVWRADPSASTRTVDKHVESLRRKLGDWGARIETVIGAGYVLRTK